MVSNMSGAQSRDAATGATPSIAVFVHDLSATGVVRNALAIADRMSTAGWRVQLVTCRTDGAFADPRRPFEIVALQSGTSQDTPRGAALACVIPQLRRHLRTTRPDILLSAGNHAHIICWAATRGLRTPQRVYRISNDLRHGGAGPGLAIKAALRRASMRLLARDAAQLVLVSPKLLEEPVLGVAKRRGKVTVIHNGVAVAVARRRISEPCNHPWVHDRIPIVLAIGRLVPQKNFPRLLQAMACANRKRELRLIILGSGTAKRQDALAGLAAELGIAHRVSFAGVVKNPFPFLGNASVVALPSLWEGSSNVLLEAMACGTPVVASRTAGDAADVLDNGRYGLLVDPENPEAIASALLRQCDSETRILPGRRAEAFDIGLTLDQYELLFSQLTASGVPAAAVPTQNSI